MNRLIATHRHNIGNGVSTWSNAGIIDAYKEQASYDANGNIKTYLRNGDPGTSGLLMDDLTYQYERNSSGRLISNKLRYVGDEVRGNTYTGDIKSQVQIHRNNIISDYNISQVSDNYQYDKIGNLVKDNAEHIDKIDWTVYGKIKSIIKNATGSPNTTIAYTYDAGGNRIGKGVQAGENLTTTYYVRDAQGNVMGIYKKDGTTFTWQEQHLYGSSRIGMVNPNLNIATGQPLGNEAYSGMNDPLDNGIVGIRNYELSNHLGNVLSVISDKKTGVDDGNGGIDHYIAEVLSQNDYYPGGMLLPGRTYSPGNYAYGFNGKRKDSEIYGEGNAYDFGNRILDPRLGGRWLSVDPLQHEYPGESPYLYTGGNPIIYIDPDGKKRIITYVINNQKTGEKIELTVIQNDDIKAQAREVTYMGTKCTHCGYQKKYTGTEYDWYDINEVDNITIDKQGNQSVSVTEGLGDKRTTTDREWTLWAKLKVGEGYLNESPKDKKYSSRGGSILYSKYGKNGETTVSTSMDIDMIDVEGLMGVLNLTTSNGFDKGNLLKKLGQLLSPSVEKKSEKAAEILDKIKDVLDLNEDPNKAPGIEPGKSTIDPVFKKPGAVIYHRSGGYKTKQTKGGRSITNEPVTDTFPTKKGYDYWHPHN